MQNGIKLLRKAKLMLEEKQISLDNCSISVEMLWRFWKCECRA